jgi:hypothetical protein
MNISAIKADARYLAGATSATYVDIDLTRNINISYQDVARKIWESQNGWQFDDSNSTTLPIATTSLVNNQQDYELPSTAQRLERVQIMDTGGDWHLLKQIDIHDIDTATEEFLQGAGMPAYYDLVGRSIMLYPIPTSDNVTLTNGLQIHVNRDVTEFSVSATTTVPGFATPFHRILSYAAAIDFTKEEKDRNFFILMKDRLEKGLTRFYSKRDVERKTTMQPAGKKNWRKYT